jgi:hypothetical protein
MTGRLSTADEQRLSTWNLEIAEALYNDQEPPVDHGDERHYGGHGGLFISKKSGAWLSLGSGQGGWTALGLIGFLKNCSYAEAVEFGVAWLNSHGGTGAVLGFEDDEGDPRLSPSRKGASAARAEAILKEMVPPEGTHTEIYLRSRKLPPPYPNCVKHLEHARVGESAMVGLLTADGRITGVQLTYLDPDGCKSTVEPVRQRFDLEYAPHAVFLIQEARHG